MSKIGKKSETCNYIDVLFKLLMSGCCCTFEIGLVKPGGVACGEPRGVNPAKPNQGGCLRRALEGILAKPKQIKFFGENLIFLFLA
jgi:hypothetical protein